MIKCPRCFRDALYDTSQDLFYCLRCGFIPATTRVAGARYAPATIPTEAVETRFTRHLLAVGSPLTVREIADGAGLPRSSVFAAARRLEKRGILQHTGAGTKSDPRKWYLTPAALEAARQRAWSIAEAATELGVSVPWIEKMIKRYRVGQRIGSRRVLFERDLELLRQIKAEREDMFALGQEMTRLRLDPAARKKGKAIPQHIFKEVHRAMIEEREAKKRAKRAAAM